MKLLFRHTVLAILSVACLLCFSPHVQAQIQLSAALREIVAVDLYAGPELRAFAVGTQLTGQTEGLSLPERVIGLTENGGTWCRAVWFPSQVDTSTPGRKTVPGRLIPPDGYTVSDTAAALSLPVFIYEPGGQTADTISQLQTGEVSGLLIPLGASSDILVSFAGFQDFQTVIGTTDSGDSIFCSVEYDSSTFQTGKTGWNQLSGRVSPPEGIGIADQLQSYSYPYYVMDPQKIDLSYFSPRSDGSYLFQWLYEVDDPENFFLEYAVNGSSWTAAAPNSPGDGWFRLQENQMILLASRQWIAGNTYAYRVRYRGEISNWVEFTVTEDGCAASLHDGDRDGGDRNQQVIPNTSNSTDANQSTQPSQQPSQKDLPANAAQGSSPREMPAGEEETQDRSVWSGRRLLTIKETTESGFYTFEKHGIRVQIPWNAEAFASLSEESLLSVEIRSLSPSSFSLEITLDGSPLNPVPEMSITMPYSPSDPNAIFQIVDDAEVALADATYSQTDGALCFCVQQTGLFEVRETRVSSSLDRPASQAVEDRPKHTSPAVGIGVTGGLFLFAAVLLAILFCRRRLKHDC